jgi:GT2 family glycosyltransferase
LLLNCVESVFKSKYENLEVIVVDNASSDKSHITCKEKFNKIRLISNETNLGYCEGNNIGIKQAKGDFIAILNPDTIVEPSWLDELVSAYNNFGEGLYQPKLLSYENHKIFNSAGNMIQIFGFGYSRGKGEMDEGQFEESQIISYSSGACLFTSTKVFERIGLFDPFLFAYHDDLDLGWRASLLGIKSYYIPKSVVYHAESFSFKWSPYKFFLLERNRYYCLLTNYSRSTFFKILPALVLVEIAIFFFYLSKGLLKSKINAYIDIVKKRKQISIRYNEIKEKRKENDNEIIKNFQNEIFVPKQVANSLSNKLFNNLIITLSKISRVLI